MSKIDINNINIIELKAKLLIISMEFSRNDILFEGKEKVIEFALNKVKDTFIYPIEVEEVLMNHLVLFLIGNNDNCISKAIGLK